MLAYLSDTLAYWGQDKLDGRHFADEIFKCISFIKNVCVLIKIWLKVVSMDPIDKVSALV